MDQPARYARRLALPVLTCLCLHAPLAAAGPTADESTGAGAFAGTDAFFPDPPSFGAPHRTGQTAALRGPFLPDPPTVTAARHTGWAGSALEGPFLPDPPAPYTAVRTDPTTAALPAAFFPDPPTLSAARRTKPGTIALEGPFFPDPPTPTDAASNAADARTSGKRIVELDADFLRDFDETFDLFAPLEEPVLGAALDGPAESAERAAARSLDEYRRRLARHGAWLGADAPTANARQLLERIVDAGAHGLDPARYDLEGLHEGLRALFDPRPPRALVPPHRSAARRSTAEPIAFDTPARAALVYRFDRAFSRLAEDLGRGLVDGRTVQTKLYRDAPSVDVAPLREAIASGRLDVAGALDSVAPTHARYRRLVETMRALLVERASGVRRTRVDEDGALEAGDHHPDVMRVKHRLIETGELPVDTPVTPMFDSGLVLAVEAFRRRNGLPPAGIVDRRLRDALNLSVEDELDALALSLERWRWMPRELGERHVFVNLPDYRLTLDNGAQRIVDMPVVIGATKHPTPSFSREMSYLEFNPTWTVPPKIAYKELLPIERRRPGYLKSRNFDFMKVVNGKLEKVPHSSVSRSDLNLRPFPYYLRQRGGPGNALGRMKFMMPNPHAIYLHDTQAQHHFSLHERAYSHGCIRLSDPDRLAKLVLQIDGRTLGQAEELIESASTRRARLARPLPTHLAYFTTWVDERGAVQRRADVYGHDKALRAALRAHGVLPSVRLASEEQAPG